MRIRRMLTTAIITAAVAVTAIVLNPTEAQAASGWNQNSTGWWWENADGSYPANAWQKINGIWYYFDGSGYMVTGWQQINGNWYYMDASGSMLTGWQQINGTWYYMYENGAMASNTYIGSYYVDASGAWVSGGGSSASGTTGAWKNDGGRWWYRNADGSYPANAWKEISGTWYHFDSSGWMQTGWLDLGNDSYYLDDASGAMLTGWQKVENQRGYQRWYYYNENGAMDKTPSRYYLDWEYITSEVNKKLLEDYPGSTLATDGTFTRPDMPGVVLQAGWETTHSIDGTLGLARNTEEEIDDLYKFCCTALTEKGVKKGNPRYSIGVFIKSIKSIEVSGFEGQRDVEIIFYR